MVDDKTVKLLDRPIDYQGSIIGYDVLSKTTAIIACRNTSEYLLEMMRGIGVESREIIADIIELRKLLEVKQFEDNPTVSL